MTEQEIWDIVPSYFQEQIEKRNLKSNFILAVFKNCEFLNNGERKFRVKMHKDYKNFADFMYSAFTWNNSPQRFRWWFQCIFNKYFVHPSKLDGQYADLKTNDFVRLEIEKYDDSTIIARNFDSPFRIYNYDDYDSPSYSKYAGSYAQDIERLSDDFIDDVLGGEPDAYWNID